MSKENEKIQEKKSKMITVISFNFCYKNKFYKFNTASNDWMSNWVDKKTVGISNKIFGKHQNMLSVTFSSLTKQTNTEYCRLSVVMCLMKSYKWILLEFFQMKFFLHTKQYKWAVVSSDVSFSPSWIGSSVEWLHKTHGSSDIIL